MTPFSYVRASSPHEALTAAGERGSPPASFLAGGTCLLDLMKQGVERPSRIIDLNFAPDLAAVNLDADGALHVGAMARLSHVERDPLAAGWPLLREAIVDGLTPQLRNAATFGGNISQRPRCIYFREDGFACNKRRPGSGCAAKAGVHYQHALFGGPEVEACIAVHPSDLCVALTALDARVSLRTSAEARTLHIEDFHRLPGVDPTRETNLRPGELIEAVVIPPQGRRGGAYVKGPEEGFALVSCAMLFALDGGVMSDVRVVLGGVAHKPWRQRAAEAALEGAKPTPAALDAMTEAALTGAVTDAQTAFRLTLARAVIAEAFERALSRAEALR